MSTTAIIVGAGFTVIIAILWYLNRWDSKCRASMTPAQRDAEDAQVDEDARNW